MVRDIQDKQYLALELTKISYPPIKDLFCTSDETILKTYEYFLKELTNTLEEIDTIHSIKSELARLQKENDRLKRDNQDILKPFCEQLKKALDENVGDMEPRVYTQLFGIIQSKIQ